MSTASIRLEQDLGRLVTAVAEPRALDLSEQLQQEHYDHIAADYEAHYSDASSLNYRQKFIYEPMFAGLNLAGMKVLDAMCGAGQTTEHLLLHEANVTGLDISPAVIDQFDARWESCSSVCRSLLDSGLPDESYDCVAIVGGLHHIQPHVSRAVREIHRVLKPGGYFCFMEPHTGSFPDIIRRLWYKHDRFFSDNEEAIDVQALEREFAADFEFRRVKYSGNIAFLLVLNSMIFRIPLRAKPFYSPVLLKLEALIDKLQGKKTSCFVVGQWQKR